MSEAMTDATTRPARRLTDAEMSVWLPLIRVVQLLPQALDRTLREESGINHAHYAILVTLARSKEAAVTMGELAQIAGLSRSRLSHAIDALAARGWVRRSACAVDKRSARPVLTDEGWEVLRAAAPAHVAQIRELILDRLDESELEQLAAIANKLLPEVERAL
ncbi:MarR family winged helix-turn-helix transcriptional regulator [Microbacterium sp. P05]|uniref:MarR family winged helix-turn-helix transcriptional regulator n=1 Tax=Microbacterium sp. P05 TaxID=3366948 RepID=UPI0037451DE8